ncbi:MAG: Cyclic-phosphate processing Receiver domain [Acidobacteriota bacterium]|nr:Cyclic-phosphate processing Receiver domain [Acidobacteriota bacterium]
MTRKVLIVEDDGTRCEWFRHRLAHCELDVTCNVQEAIDWLGEREYELILLDHDLREEHYFSDERDDAHTGYGVAAWLAAHADSQPRATVIVHSLNYAGAARMIEKLLEAGFDAEHVPFPLLQSGLRF